MICLILTMSCLAASLSFAVMMIAGPLAALQMAGLAYGLCLLIMLATILDAVYPALPPEGYGS